MFRLILKCFLLVLIFIISICFTIALFSSISYMIYRLLPLTFYQASLLTIGTALVLSIVFMSFALISYSQDMLYPDMDFFDDDDEYPEEQRLVVKKAGGAVKVFSNGFRLINTSKINSNEPCPCNSGKSYKNCCGRIRF
ncbi:MAG: SEC-C domain-containing protein [Desulfobacterales bacterium]|nr:SEC-C domain-containing protein [Desulfobacterales bacterium]